MILKLKNSAWILLEKLISILGLLLVNSFVAKYVGPSIFGTIAISLVTFQFVQSISQMGADIIIIKRISINVKSGVKLLFSSSILIGFLYVIFSLISLLFLLTRHYSTDILFFSLAALLACLFSTLDLASFFNEATLKSKFNVYANTIGLIISLLLRFLISFLGLNYKFLVIPIVLVTFIPFVIKWYFFIKNNKYSFDLKFTNFIRYSRYLLLSGSSILLSFIAIALYTRFNQFSVNYFLGMENSGTLGVALVLSSAWVFVPNALLTSFYPSLFREKSQERAEHKFFMLMVITFIISTIIIISIYLLSSYIVITLYGMDFEQAINLILPLSIASMFAVLSGLSDRFIIKNGGNKYLIKKSIFLLIICVVSSLLFIKHSGVIGAAYSILLTEFCAFTISNYCFKKINFFKIQLRLLNPFYYIFLYRVLK